MLKSTSLFQGGGGKSKSDGLTCSLGKGKNEQAMCWGVVTAPTCLSIALWSPWLENKTQCIGLHSNLCGVCETNSSPNYHDDELVPVEKFYSGQDCNLGNTCFHALPTPIPTSSHPRLNTCSPCQKLFLGVWALFPFRNPQTCFQCMAAASLHPLHLAIRKYLIERIEL